MKIKFSFKPFQMINDSLIRSTAQRALDLVLPPCCVGCDRAITDPNLLCGKCWRKIDWIERPYCRISGLPFAYDLGEEIASPDILAHPPVYDMARSVTRFGELERHLVHQLKYYDRTDLAPVLAKWMARAGADCLKDKDAWLVPVPLHHRRLWQRHFNQSALLAKHIAQAEGLHYAYDLLQRLRATRQQVGLSEEERYRNVQGAFRVRENATLSLSGRTIILIDDVWTTGATLEACTRALKRAGAGAVHIITFARVVEPTEMTI